MPQTDIPRAQARAKALGYVVLPSTRKHKKLDAYHADGRYITSFGDLRYSDWLQHGDASRRANFKKRHAHTRGVKESASWFADKILW